MPPIRNILTRCIRYLRTFSQPAILRPLDKIRMRSPRLPIVR